MNKSALTVQCKASNRYNPYVLSRYLSKETDGTIIVNRASAVQTEDDERLFLVVLNYDYLWGYKNPEHVTVYFETDGETVIGGVYNMHTQERQSRRVIVTEMGKGKTYDCLCYSYNTNTLKKIIRAIQNAPQRAK